MAPSGKQVLILAVVFETKKSDALSPFVNFQKNSLTLSLRTGYLKKFVISQSNGRS